jgi:thiamine-phosphate pyrophosphorylase
VSIVAITDRRLMVPAELTDPDAIADAFGAAIRRAGHRVVQVREKDLDGGPLLRLVRAALATGARVLVNDRLDVALAAGAHGVHLPERGLGIGDAVHDLHSSHARSRTTPRISTPLSGDALHDLHSRNPADRFLIGVSRHDPDADCTGADLVQLGPIFATPGKGPPLGVEALRRMRDRLPASIQLVAVGGIDMTNAGACLAAGADTVAMIRAAWK